MRTEDGYIIHKCLSGDSAAFGFLADKYKASIYAFAYSRLHNFHDAEDVTQEVFIKAYQKLRTLRQYDNFLAWLYAITSNLCKMLIRARSGRPDREFMEDSDPETLEILSIDHYREKLARESLHESLQEALDSLPEIYRQVLILYYLGGMSNKEIARFLGTSSATIRQRLSRARSQLKEEMLAMMSTTFEEQRLQASFTFRIVEAVKRIKIQPMPRMTGLPWGLSLAAGIIITILSLNPHLNILNPASFPTGSRLPMEAKVLETGEIPVDILKISQIPAPASRQRDGNNADRGNNVANPVNASLLAPQAGEGTWTKKANMNIARWAHSSVVLNGKIYVIGAFGKAAGMEIYDPKTDTWIMGPKAGGVSLGTSVVNGKLYAIGGGLWTAAVEEYDPATDKWTKKADMPTGRTALTTSVVNGKIYAIGGRIRGGNDKFGKAVSTVEVYDPKTDTWMKKTDMPITRNAHAASVVNDKIYVIGGCTEIWARDKIVSRVDEYDPATDTWTEKADMPTPRSDLAACTVNGKIYAIGGMTIDWVASTVESYDPATDTWTTGIDMPTARSNLSAGAIDGKIYAIGGWVPPDNMISTVEEFDTGFAGQSVLPRGKLPTTWGEVKQ